MDDPPRTARLAIRRRPSDFFGRGHVIVAQATTCSCCCCCLHWIGAAVGGTAGIVGACTADQEEPGRPVRPVTRAYVLWATWIAVLGAVAFLTVIWFAWDEELFWLAVTAAILFTVAVGVAPGMIILARAGKKKPVSPVHPVARAYVLHATWLGVVCTAAWITLAAIVTLNPSSPESRVTSVMGLFVGALVLVPSLALLPVGAAAMVGALLAKKIEGARTSDPEERQRISAGMGLAWRIAWKSFLLSTFLSGVGYLVMYVIVLLYD
jgi:hypothetical protein